MKRCLVCLICLLLLCGSALAEDAALLPDFPWERLATAPLQVEATVQLTARMPLGEERLSDLNALLRHLHITLQQDTSSAEQWHSLALTLGDAELLRLTQLTTAGGTSLMTSFSGQGYASQGDVLSLLFGTEAQTVYLTHAAGLMSVAQDADTLLGNLQDAWPDRLKDVTSKTSVSGFGTATRKKTWTVKKADAAGLSEELAALTPAGLLHDFIASLTFTGSQKLICLTDNNGFVYRMTWEGTCGVGEDQREMTIAWNRKRTDTQVKDTFTLKTPAVSGRNRDTITFTRETKMTGGQQTLHLETGNDWRRGEQRTIQKLTADLNYDGVALSGDLTFTEEKTGTVEGTSALKISPSAALLWNTEGALVNGSIAWEAQRDGHVTSAGQVEVESTHNGDFDWWMPALCVSADGMSEEERTALVSHWMELAASRLVKQAIRLPAEDVLYLSRDLDGWEEIVAAGGGSADILMEEGNP